MLKRTSGIILPKSHSDYNKIKSDLDRYIVGWNQETTKVSFYNDLGDSILIPRFYPVNEEIKDESVEGTWIDIKSNIKPKNNRQKKAIDFLINNDCGTLKLEPGSGKTVVAIDTICKVGRKALVIVHKDKLLKQWREEFITHTSATEDDISRLSTQTFEEDFKKPIILATVQALLAGIRSKKKSQDFIYTLQNSGVGQVYLDEAHATIGPDKFSQVSLLLNCKRTIGLSATPYRTDGNEDIIKYHVGDIKYFQPEKNELLNPKIFMIYFPFKIYSRYRRYLSWGGSFITSRYYKQMVKSEDYIKTVSQLIKKLYDDNRISLVLGTRIDSLIKLSSKVGVPKTDVGAFLPSSTKEQRLSVSDTDCLDKAFKEKKIVFSTYMACRDGNNRKDLDALVMTTTTNNIEQAIGRIQRELKGKQSPIVLDLVDTEGPMIWSIYPDEKGEKKKTGWFMKSAEKRKMLYEKMGWKIKIINLE